MMNLIMAIILIIALCYTAVSLVQLIRRRRNAAPDIQYIEYHQRSVWVALIPVIILSIFSFHRILSVPEGLFLHEIREYHTNTFVCLFMSFLLAFLVCALANQEIICDEKAITVHTFLGKDLRFPYTDILFAEYDHRTIWFPTTYGAFKLYCDDDSYIEFYYQPKKFKKPFHYINDQYLELFGESIPQKQPDSDWNQGRWIAVAGGNGYRSGEMHIQHPPTGKWKYLCMLIPFFICMPFFSMILSPNDNYYEVTFTEYYTEACDEDCQVYLISPQLDAPVYMGYGSSWAAIYGETLTRTIVNGQRHYENFGEDLEIILSRCNGKETFDMYANYIEDGSSVPRRYKQYYDPYYLADSEWIYIDNNAIRYIRYLPLLPTVFIMLCVYYALYYKPRKRNQKDKV